MTNERYNPPIPVELIWRDAIGIPGPVNLDSPKGATLCYIGYLSEIKDGFITLVAEYNSKAPEEQRDRGDIPLENVVSIRELLDGGLLYDETEDYR